MPIIKNIKIKKNDTIQNIPIYSNKSEIGSAQAIKLQMAGGG